MSKSDKKQIELRNDVPNDSSSPTLNIFQSTYWRQRTIVANGVNELESCWASRPRNDLEQAIYPHLRRRVSLKRDLGWSEVKNLQGFLRQSDGLTKFPMKDVQLAAVEFKPGDLNQRVDLLYIDSNGGLFPAELKLGGNSLDAAGQLVRYMADLDQQAITIEYVRKKFQKTLDFFAPEFGPNYVGDIHLNKFNEFLDHHHITQPHLVDRKGWLINEEFPPQLEATVAFLNRRGFDIRLIRLDAFVDENWQLDFDDRYMRIDLVDITPQNPSSS